MTRVAVAALFACLLNAITVQGTIITVKNQCSTGITAFARAQTSPTNTYQLAANGGSQDLNVGSTWVGGLIWASPTGNANNGQATQVEFTTNGYGANDFFDISLVTAYNLGVLIQPSTGCKAARCSIGNLQSFCQSPNVYRDGFCINTAGPGTVATASTQQFKAACPQAYSYSKDDGTSTFACPTGVNNYQVIFCP